MAESSLTNTKTAELGIDISADIERFASLGILGTLLADRSTGGNIIWASNVFSDKGESYAPEDEIFIRDITGDNAGIIRTRASKDRDDQIALTRAHAEVFTPFWVVRKMVDWADEAWYKAHEPHPSLWQRYVRSPRLEITCGEAPFLVTRYDAADGTRIPVYRRHGVLDRKLIQITEHTTTRRSWLRFVLMALRSTYGYEYQGDNLLIARVNVMATMEDFLDTAGWDPYTPEEYQKLAEIISWNLWQMDGLKSCVPNGALGVEEAEMRLPGFDELYGTGGEQMKIGISRGRGAAKIFDWENGREVEFRALKREVTPMDNEQRIRFDYIIGNPPYQDENDANGRQPPIYDRFMDESYPIGDVVELITPARFLFNAGQTSKAWNKKMLADEHLRVVYYEPDATKVFPNTDIKGGVAITLRNDSVVYGALEVFTAYPELNSLLKRINKQESGNAHLDTIIASQGLFRFSDAFFTDFARDPNAQFFMSTGTKSKILSSAMEKMPNAFVLDGRKSDVRFLGRVNRQRQWRYIKRKYIRENEYLDSYKLFIPEANNSGHFGETLTDTELGRPGDASADTFLNAGPFATQNEAENLDRYYRTKFFRALLGVRKVTQHSPSRVWKTIPLQNFTSASDIDWSQTIADIDQQLYAKYGLTQDEIDFIESHVKEMQ